MTESYKRIARNTLFLYRCMDEYSVLYEGISGLRTVTGLDKIKPEKEGIFLGCSI